MNRKGVACKRQSEHQKLGVVLGGKQLDTIIVVLFFWGPQLYDSVHNDATLCTCVGIPLILLCTLRKLCLFLICGSLRVFEGVCGIFAAVLP